MDSLDKLRDHLLAEVQAAADPDALEKVRVAALGRQGRITELMKGLGKVPAEERRAHGQALNALKDSVGEALSLISPTCCGGWSASASSTIRIRSSSAARRPLRTLGNWRRR